MRRQPHDTRNVTREQRVHGGRWVVLFSPLRGERALPTRVNVVLDDDVKADLDRLVESGMRSRSSTALRREILMLRRQRASQRLDELRKTTEVVATSELVNLARRDRGR